MDQPTLTASTHSPNSETIHVPSNGTAEGEDMTWTGGGSCYELPDNLTCMERHITGNLPYLAPMQLDEDFDMQTAWITLS